MDITGRQKKLLTILLMGLVSLVVDRTILRPGGGPNAASADALHPSDQSVPLTDNIPVLAEEQESSMAERLTAVWPAAGTDFTQMRDPFSLPASWSDNGDGRDREGLDATATFIGTHRLTAVVIDGRESYAVLDDRFFVPGQSVDGFVLLSVGDRSAVFERDGRRITLELVDE